MSEQGRGLVTGAWQALDGGSATRAVIDPARDHVIAEVPDTPETLVDETVADAWQAFSDGEWRRRPAEERGSVLCEIACRVRRQADEFARLESLNVGKPIGQAEAEVAGAADVFEYYGRLTADMPGEIPQFNDSKLTLVVREPHSVVGAIVPWNYPLMITALSVAPTLAAGCSVVVKPSELTPLTAIELCHPMTDLVPAHTASLILGDGTIGRQLVRHSLVESILFTGSTSVGKEIVRSAAQQLKRVTLELGGKAPIVVLDDAPLDQAADDVLRSMVTNQGENCGAGTRLLLHGRIYDAFLERLLKRAAAVRIGDPQDRSVTVGPMISKEHYAKVRSYIDDLRDEEIMYRSSVPAEKPLDDGFFVPLTLTAAGPGTRVWREEIFGPVLSVVRFDREGEALELAHDTEYGLFASIWSGDTARAIRFARNLRVGVIRINGGTEPVQAPWGGFKQSGIGRSSGRYGIESVSELKVFAVGLDS